MAYYNGKKVLSAVAVEYLAPRGNIKLTENGSYDIRAYQKAVVSVFPSGTIQTIEDEGVAQGAGAFPLTILPKGLINYVGGMSQKVNQMADGVCQTQTANGITFTNNNDGTLSVNGTATANVYISPSLRVKYDLLENHKYLVSGKRFGMYLNNTYQKFNNEDYGIYSVPSGGAGEYNYQAFIRSGETMNTRFVPMICNLTEIYGAGNEPTSTSDPRIPQLISLLKKYPQYNEGSIVSAKVVNLLSTDGTNESNYSIPAEVQALDGYGLGIDDTLYNYIDFERKKFVKKVGILDLGSIEWVKRGGVGTFPETPCFQSTAIVNLVKRPASSAVEANAVCQKYSILSWSALAGSGADKVFSIAGDGYLNVRDNAYSTSSDFKTAMNGVYLVYELAEPVETDISEYLDRDFPNENLIDLYADGKVYFENENDMGVPYSLTYQERIN